MIGIFLRSKIAIVLALLGLIVLALGVGQRTIWLPPATVTASVASGQADAPLTVIGTNALNANNGHYTMNIKAKGPINLAVGSSRDVNAWVGSAAHTAITEVNADFTSVTATAVKGEAKVPNPAGSDLWVAEQEADGSLEYTWQAPGNGSWSVLLFADGTAPAPTDISLTRTNDQSTPWAIPLMIIGSVLLALAALLFWIAPAKRKPEAAAVRSSGAGGRRSAGKPSDPETGALEVARILAANEAATGSLPVVKPAASETESSANHSTIADLNRSQREVSADPTPKAEPLRDEQNGAASLPSESTTSIPVADEPSTPEPKRAESDSDTLPGSSESAKDQEHESGDSDDSGDDADGSSNGGSDHRANGNSDSEQIESANDSQEQDSKKQRPDSSDFAMTTEQAQIATQRKSRFSLRARVGAVLATAVLAGGASPALAAETPSPSASPTGTSSASSETSTQAPSSGAGASIEQVPTPELLLSQVQRIVSDVATVVASGDSAKNAKDLEPRVTGMALQTREANYKIRSKVSAHAAVEPVAATKLLTYVSPNDGDWPRTAVALTQGADNKLPQLLVLRQESARENYKLTQQSPLLPGQTFPEISIDNVSKSANDSANSLLMSPNDAVAAFKDVLNDSNSKAKANFAASDYVTQTAAYKKETIEKSKDATVSFVNTADADSVTAYKAASGGVMVLAGYTLKVETTLKDKATLDPAKQAKEITALAGDSKDAKGLTVSFVEPVVLYIPPASAGEKISVVSAFRDIVSAKLK